MERLKKILVIGNNDRSTKHINAIKKISKIKINHISYREFIAKKELKEDYDFFLVCAKWDKNYQVVNALVKKISGKIILSEKPLTKTVKFLNKNKLVLLYDRRHYKNINLVKKKIDQNKPNTVFINFSDNFHEKRDRLNLNEVEDYLHIYFVHIMDTIIYLFGEIQHFTRIYNSAALNSYVLSINKTKIFINIFKQESKFTQISIVNDKMDMFLFENLETLRACNPNNKLGNFPIENREKVLEKMWSNVLNTRATEKFTTINEESINNKLINFFKKGQKC